MMSRQRTNKHADRQTDKSDEHIISTVHYVYLAEIIIGYMVPTLPGKF